MRRGFLLKQLLKEKPSYTLKFTFLVWMFAIGSIATSSSLFSPYAMDDETARTVTFAGCEWRVKAGRNLPPASNDWSDEAESVWVDDEGKLHLRIRRINGRWHSAQVNATDYTNFGTHRFFVETPLHDLDENVVLGLFLYRDDHHEIDVELVRRGEAFNAVYAVQPSNLNGHRKQFQLGWDGTTTHEINWEPQDIFFRSLQGYDLSDSDVLHEWRFQGEGVPQEGDNLRIQMNLWLRDPALASEPVEVVIAGVESPGCVR